MDTEKVTILNNFENLITKSNKFIADFALLYYIVQNFCISYHLMPKFSDVGRDRSQKLVVVNIQTVNIQ